MSVLRFEGTPTLDDDMVDSHYLALTRALKLVGELSPSEEEQGGITVCSHGEVYTTHATSENMKLVPVLYFGQIAVGE